MLRALAEYVVVGPITNIAFHRWVLRHPRFRAGDIDTGFIPQEFKGLPARGEGLERVAIVAAAIAALDGDASRPTSAAAPSTTARRRGVRRPPRRSSELVHVPGVRRQARRSRGWSRGRARGIVALSDPHRRLEQFVDARVVAGGLSLLIEGKNHEVSLTRSADDFDVLLENRRFRFRLLTEERARRAAARGGRERPAGARSKRPCPGRSSTCWSRRRTRRAEAGPARDRSDEDGERDQELGGGRGEGDPRRARPGRRVRRSPTGVGVADRSHDERARSRPLHLHAGRVPRLPHHHAGPAAAAHAAHVGDQRHLRHLAGRLAGRRRQRLQVPAGCARSSASSRSPARRPTSSAAS